MREIDDDLVERLLRLIERYEVTLDGEFGNCRDLDVILKDEDMPKEYYELQVIRPKFDRVAYQREYMRKWRAKK